MQEVAGVTTIASEDREVWLVQGRPSGRDLPAAVAGVLDNNDDLLRRAM